MTPNEALHLYAALKLHFTSSKYDFIKYQGKIKPLDFTKRNDKHFFAKLSRHRDPKNLLISNLVVKPSLWIGDLFLADAEERFRKMVGRWESLSYVFKEDLKQLNNDFNQNFEIKDNQHPIFLKLYLQKKICLETLVILDELVSYYGYWQKELDDPLWSSMSLIIVKYKPFFQFDKSKMKQLVLERYKT